MPPPPPYGEYPPLPSGPVPGPPGYGPPGYGPPPQPQPQTTNGFAISIEAGCNGIEAALILIAAMLAFPAPWKHRAIGILAGLAAVQALNVVRVVSLFYIGQWDLRVFQWAHLYLWQALIMLDVLIVWLIWIRTLPPPPSPVPAS